jgi:hypothetical protein
MIVPPGLEKTRRPPQARNMHSVTPIRDELADPSLKQGLLFLQSPLDCRGPLARVQRARQAELVRLQP